MLAAIARAPGPAADVVDVVDVPEPAELRRGEVAVRMLASTINPSDLISIAGAYRSRTSFPFVPGFEGVGEIVRVGPDVPGDAVGRRVLPIGSAGNWQEVKASAYRWCVPVPDDIVDDAACFAYINPLTALLMVERFVAEPAGNVVITAATAAIAGHLAELLSRHGRSPIGLVRGSPGRRVPAPACWRAVLTTSDPDWPRQLSEEVGGARVDVVFDCVGGPGANLLLELMRPGGTFVHYGLLSGIPLAVPRLGSSGPLIELFRLRDVVHTASPARLVQHFHAVFEHLRAGRLRTEVAARHPLAALPHALRSEPHGGGKHLITIAR